MTSDASFWNKLAQEYARKPVENQDAFERKIAITQERMLPGATVLDMGCGTGSLALRLAPKGGHIHGLDFSSEMIRIAQNKAKDEKIENITFHVGPIDSSFTALGPESLDGICAYSILHLVEDRAAMLQQIFRLLKPGGFFISSTVCLGESRLPFGALLRVMRWLGKAPMVKILSKQTLESEILREGFVELTQPEVGAKPIIGFMVATKPA